MFDVDVRSKHKQSKYRYFYTLDPEDAAVIFDFFVVFSRFEFALKRAGYFKKDKVNAEPDWNAFCKAVEEKFDKTISPEFQEACEYYIKYPPRKQVIKDGKVAWKNNLQGNKGEFERIIASVKTVRNNLFHGGKFPYDIGRDTPLLFHALMILHECIKYDRHVEMEFKSGHM